MKIFLVIVRTLKVKEIFRLTDKDIDEVGFIVPKCREQGIATVHKEYSSHIIKFTLLMVYKKNK